MSNLLTGVQPALRDHLTQQSSALAGDMAFKCTPATITRAATAALWTRTVVVTLETAAGALHDWYNATVTTGVSIADTSTAGTASIPSTTLTFVNGKATVVVAGDAAAWLATETDTLTVTSKVIMGYTIAAKTSVQTFT